MISNGFKDVNVLFYNVIERNLMLLLLDAFMLQAGSTGINIEPPWLT